MDEQQLKLEKAYAAIRYMGMEIQRRRVKLNKTIPGLSFTTGLSKEDIMKIEQGIDTGNAADILVLCEVLGMDYADLIKASLEYAEQQISKE